MDLPAELDKRLAKIKANHGPQTEPAVPLTDVVDTVARLRPFHRCGLDTLADIQAAIEKYGLVKLKDGGYAWDRHLAFGLEHDGVSGVMGAGPKTWQRVLNKLAEGGFDWGAHVKEKKGDGR